jgi:hypothetical protein
MILQQLQTYNVDNIEDIQMPTICYILHSFITNLLNNNSID